MDKLNLLNTDTKVADLTVLIREGHTRRKS